MNNFVHSLVDTGLNNVQHREHSESLGSSAFMQHATPLKWPDIFEAPS